jgi:hypothetical protein
MVLINGHADTRVEKTLNQWTESRLIGTHTRLVPRAASGCSRRPWDSRG